MKMATSAFGKSTSRREPKSHPPAAAGGGALRRAHSVSAVSRKGHHPSSDYDSLISTEFSNSRDNPLFWAASSSSPPDEDGRISGAVTRKSEQSHSLDAISTRNAKREQRGRSFTRDAGEKKGIGRSLSRVRGRSVSRDPCGGAYEKIKELDMVTSTGRSRNVIKNISNGVYRTRSIETRGDTLARAKNAGIAMIRNRAPEESEDDSACSFKISNLEDGVSITSLSEAEEKTIKPVCEDLSLMVEQSGIGAPHSQIYETVQSEVRRAISDIQKDLVSVIQRNSSSTVAAINVSDMPSGLVDPGAVELISDIRREYAAKLQESEERARKLRSDLAIEEHRGKELDRILKEMLPDPKISGNQSSRRGRRTSNERRRMSRRLNEEAMAYFDECVSLSTFDSSDFSAPEDPLFSSVGGTLSSSLAKGSPRTSCSYDQGSGPEQICIVPPQLNGFDHSRQTSNSTGSNPGISQLSQFSFADTMPENPAPHDDIRSCIKIFSRGTIKDINFEASKSHYDAGEYNAFSHIESVLIDRVLENSRIESGGLLLCGGATSLLPFASVML